MLGQQDGELLPDGLECMVALRAWIAPCSESFEDFPNDLAFHAQLINCRSLRLLAEALTWFATPSDVSSEVNDGRGPVDFKISRGSLDKSLVEFKLASNTKLQRNLEKQIDIYKSASDTSKALKVILFFTDREYAKVNGILNRLGIGRSSDIILIDGRANNKPSGSKA